MHSVHGLSLPKACNLTDWAEGPGNNQRMI